MNKEQINESIKSSSEVLFSLLSEKGKSAFYPKSGILAQSDEAKDTDINATIGISNFDNGEPMHYDFIDEIINLKPKEIYPYTSSPGNTELRNVWKDHITSENEITEKFSLPIVTAGITHALFVGGELFLDKDEEIIIHDKFWGNYKLIFENENQGKITTYNTFKDNTYDTESLRECLKSKGEKIVLLFNFPNNPSGYTPSEEELIEIKNILLEECEKGKKVVTIVDDAYFGLFYDETSSKKSLFSYLCNAHENLVTIKCDGATKEDFAWGLRVGFISFNNKNLSKDAYEALEMKAAGIVRGTVSNVSTLSQNILLKVMQHEEYSHQKEKSFNVLKNRFLKVKEVLQNPRYEEFFKPLPFNSGYFMCIELREGLDAENLRGNLIKEYSTGVISQGNLIRIAFSSVREDRIEELFENIYWVSKKFAV